MTITLQDRLRQLREEAGYSQEKLAAILGVTRMTLAGYELGKRLPDSGYIQKVAREFDCTPDYIFGVNPFKNSRHYEEWVSSTNTLSLGLSLLPNEKRKELVTALNWILQDNYGVNTHTQDRDYLIDAYINITLPFTQIFQEFTRVIKKSDQKSGVDGKDIFHFYQLSEKNKADMYETVGKVANDLLSFLLEGNIDSKPLHIEQAKTDGEI